MTVMVFLWLHAFKALSSPYDSYFVCVLLALDLLTAVQILRWRAYLKR